MIFLLGPGEKVLMFDVCSGVIAAFYCGRWSQDVGEYSFVEAEGFPVMYAAAYATVVCGCMSTVSVRV